MNIVALVLVLFMQHDQMHMPGMQMKKPPAKKQQPKTKKPKEQPHEQPSMPDMPMPAMSMPAMSMPAMSMPMPVANPDIKVIVGAPRSSSDIASLRPGSTLKPDELDAPKEPQ